MNEYELEYANGKEWIYADRYELEDEKDEYVFYARDVEIIRINAKRVKSIHVVKVLNP